MPPTLRRFGLSALALTGMLGAGGLAFAFRPRQAPAAQTAPVLTPVGVSKRPTLLLSPQPAPRALTRFEQLSALRIENETTRETRELRLYDPNGQVDEAAAAQLDELLCDARSPKRHETTRLNRRTLQLLYKAAYHFSVYEVEVVSAYRKPGRRREGPHGTGAAIDFRLRGIAAAELASYLRELPRTGVGVYTNKRTQYVHIDSREHSFHWLDASPPRRHWREKSIGAPDLEKRDALYSPAQDWP